MTTKIHLELDEIFWSAFLSGGGFSMDCHCGKNHIAIETIDEWDEWDADPHGVVDMKLSYQEMAKNDDNLILHYDCDSIHYITLANRHFVYDCDCEGWKPYMDFLFSQRKEIAHFLLGAQKELRRLNDQADLIDMVAKEYNIR